VIKILLLYSCYYYFLIKCNYLLFFGVVIGECIKSSLTTLEFNFDLGVEFERGLTLDDGDMNNGGLIMFISSVIKKICIQIVIRMYKSISIRHTQWPLRRMITSI